MTLFGSSVGSFINARAHGDGALYLLDALEGGDECLSSTCIREAVGTAEQSTVLAMHGYATETLQGRIASEATAGGAAARRLLDEGKARGEFVALRGVEG